MHFSPITVRARTLGVDGKCARKFGATRPGFQPCNRLEAVWNRCVWACSWSNRGMAPIKSGKSSAAMSLGTGLSAVAKTAARCVNVRGHYGALSYFAGHKRLDSHFDTAQNTFKKPTLK